MKNEKKLPEHWLRGPVIGVPDLLQPVAHVLLQSRDEVKKYTKDFPTEQLDTKPDGRASVGFHLKHITGVLDRMLTYAGAQPLSEEQFEYLKNETVPTVNQDLEELIKLFEDKVREALDHLKNIDLDTLTQKRYVGRKQLPSTVIGLLFHAAEHSQRHVGQLLVTVSIVKE